MGIIDDWRYSRPVLDRAGQQIFWDRQASTYDHADMTTDNAGELAIVQALCEDFIQQGYVAEDVVTLGGASGCRDPLVVLDALKHHQNLRRIVFNDLSEAMVQVALKRFSDLRVKNGYEVQGIHGPIHEIANQIPVIPRRVIIGVYRASALTEACPSEGQSYSGLEGYVRNSSIIGDHLIVEAVGLRADQYEESEMRVDISSANATVHLPIALAKIGSWYSDEQFIATRVIGQHTGNPGFFISHWFVEKSIRDLVGRCFSSARVEKMTMTKCAKGFVLCIDPIEPPRGILTILNNVVGNVLPHEQVETLRVIDRISS